jgi:hypothetical protein
MQKIMRFAKKYKIPINSSLGLPEEENLNTPETISRSEPITAII